VFVCNICIRTVVYNPQSIPCFSNECLGYLCKKGTYMSQYLTVCGLLKMYQCVVCVRCRMRVVCLCHLNVSTVYVRCILLSKMHTFIVCVRKIYM
jgi:hypothetical protein